jgi:hypothetical protein
MEYKIVRHRPGLRNAWIAGVVLLVTVAGFFLYNYTRRTTVADFERSQTERDRYAEERRRLAQALKTSQKALLAAQDEVNYLKQSKELKGLACENDKSELQRLTQENLRLRERLMLLEGYVKPGQGRLRVADFRLKAAGMDWQYDLTVMQSVKKEGNVAGSIDLQFFGTRAKQPVNLKLSTLQGKPLVFSMQYYQTLSGVLKLPADFKPLKVTVLLQGSEGSKVEEEFDWNRLLQALDHD